MNSVNPSGSPARRRSIWRWLVAILGACVLIVAIGLANLFTLNRDAASLRRELLAELQTPASARVQIDAGPGVLSLVRGVIRLIGECPPEADQALQVVRAASVGVYALRDETTASQRTAMMRAADQAMTRRNWTRVVGVTNAHETVLVYTPAKTAFLGSERVCVAVCQKDQLVIVSAALKRDALLEFVREQKDLGRFPRLSI